MFFIQYDEITYETNVWRQTDGRIHMNITSVNTGNTIQSNYQNSDSGADAGITGHVGDVIEGVVRKVSDEVTIDFNGMELKVSRSAVQDAKEGDSVKFKIMDVSNNRIVLKAMDNSESQPQGVTSTVLETGSKADSIESDVVDNHEDKTYINIENITGEDVKDVFDMQSGTCTEPENIEIEAFDRLLESIKSTRLIVLSSIEGQKEKIEQIKEAIESAAVKNKLPHGISAVVAEYFVKYDIPVTEEKLEQLGSAFSQTERITSVNDRMIKYILKNELPLTAENMYNAKFMCGVEQVENANEYKDTIFEEIIPQVKDIVNSSGYAWNDEMQERTKWLFRNDIPINSQSLFSQNILLGISENKIESMDASDITLPVNETYNSVNEMLIENMIQGMAEGKNPAYAPLYDNQYRQAAQAVQDFRNIPEEAIDKVISIGGKINLDNLRHAYESNTDSIIKQNNSDSTVAAVTARRQLEEIRLSMSVKAAKSLNDKGININTTELSKIVDGLRQIENEYYKNLLQSGGLEGTQEEINVLSETQYCRSCIEKAPVYFISDIAAAEMKQTLPECSDAAVGMNAIYDRAGETYEKLMTTPRSDMGDSIQKAFTNVDSLIKDIGLDVTAENQRIVKVLAHNQMEITVDNIEKLKNYDAKMQYLLNNLKPDTTLNLIRKGVNPLEVSMDDLNVAINEINEELNEKNQDRGENGYSRFLWKLEKESRITPEERSSYVGIYRLLNHVTRNDTAAIGAVMESGLELNLKNLMTVVRSRRDAGMNTVIDDTTGLNESVNNLKNINDQINTAFEYSYENYCAEQILDMVTPSALYDISDGRPDNIYEQPLERFSELLQQTANNENINTDYYEHLASDYRNITSDDKVMQFLNGYNIEASIFNSECTKQIIDTGQTVLSDILKLTNKDKDRTSRVNTESEYEEAVTGLTEALESDESMQSQVDKAGMAARRLLVEREQQVLSSGDLASLRSMESALRFNGLLSRRRSYEIPIQTDSGVTNINLTLVNSGKEKGKIDIRMDTKTFGNVSARFDISGNKVQGLMLVETDQIYESGMLKDMRDNIEKQGMQVLSLSEGNHKVTGTYIPDKGDIKADGAARDNASLYRLAKTVIQTISKQL